MIQDNPHLSRRTALRTVTSATPVSAAGCLNSDDSPGDGNTALSEEEQIVKRVAVAGTEFVGDDSSGEELSQINLVQSNLESFGQRETAAGSQRVSFEIGPPYGPGEYAVVALGSDELLAESSAVIRPELGFRGISLYTNKPGKPRNEVYGGVETDRPKNRETYAIVDNTGNGPEAVVELIFSGDVPDPAEDLRGSGMYKTEQVVIAPGDPTDLFSSSLPFGSKSGEGTGYPPDGNSGRFTVTVQTQVDGGRVSKTFDIRCSGPTEGSDCEGSLTEA